jgi:hypothetical protein
MKVPVLICPTMPGDELKVTAISKRKREASNPSVLVLKDERTSEGRNKIFGEERCERIDFSYSPFSPSLYFSYLL